jgi:uncharacterized protein YyaL (SSP411 family)
MGFALKFIKSFRFGMKQQRVMLNYLFSRLNREYSDEECLNGAVQWLCRAQDACQGGGLSAAYYLGRGWDGAYPETSGYAIATFLTYSDLRSNASFLERALRIGDWEVEIQSPTGGVRSNPSVSHTRVFNTAQVILGWCLLYERTGNSKYLVSAIKGGEYLLERQSPDGRWAKDTYCGPRTYHARVDWALLRLAQVSGSKKYIAAAVRNLRWVLSQATERGWFKNCGFYDEQPITHVIAYTLRGLLESHCIGVSEISEMGLLPVLEKAVGALCKCVKTRPLKGIPGMLEASFGNTWASTDRYSCLTGNAQLACVLYRLAQVSAKPDYAETADTLISNLKKTQLLSTSFSEINGAIPGSYPVYLGYMRNAYPNWASKFFADALMLKNNYLNGLRINA